MKLYRYEAEWFERGHAELRLREFEVVRETPCGYWIPRCTYFDTGKFRWVSKTTVKRYAHADKDEALEAYKKRKAAFVRHASARLERAKAERDLVDVTPGALPHRFTGLFQ